MQNKVAAANARATEQDGQHRGKTIGAAAVQSLWDDAGTSEPESENEEMEVT